MGTTVQKEPVWVLYLEDEQELADEIIEVLKDLKLHVVHCIDYTEAVQKAANQKFDAIVVDIHLKRGTGDKFIKSVKSNLNHVNLKTPILVASSHITKTIIRDIGNDIKYALVKPFQIKMLVKNIFNMMGKRPSEI